MGSVQSWSMPSEPGCIAPARNAAGEGTGLVIALRDGIYRAHEWGGTLQCMVAADHDKATTRFNDGKADPCGRFWQAPYMSTRCQPGQTFFTRSPQWRRAPAGIEGRRCHGRQRAGVVAR